jgi:hypothetical protein
MSFLSSVVVFFHLFSKVIYTDSRFIIPLFSIGNLVIGLIESIKSRSPGLGNLSRLRNCNSRGDVFAIGDMITDDLHITYKIPIVVFPKWIVVIPPIGMDVLVISHFPF